jgi:hypothetical protein
VAAIRAALGSRMPAHDPRERSEKKAELSVLKMTIENEYPVPLDTFFFNHLERDGIDQAQIPLGALCESVKPFLMEEPVDPDDIDERGESLSEASNRLGAKTAPEQGVGLQQYIRGRQERGCFCLKPLEGPSGTVVKGIRGNEQRQDGQGVDEDSQGRQSAR